MSTFPFLFFFLWTPIIFFLGFSIKGLLVSMEDQEEERNRTYKEYDA